MIIIPCHTTVFGPEKFPNDSASRPRWDRLMTLPPRCGATFRGPYSRSRSRIDFNLQCGRIDDNRKWKCDPRSLSSSPLFVIWNEVENGLFCNFSVWWNYEPRNGCQRGGGNSDLLKMLRFPQKFNRYFRLEYSKWRKWTWLLFRHQRQITKSPNLEFVFVKQFEFSILQCKKILVS